MALQEGMYMQQWEKIRDIRDGVDYSGAGVTGWLLELPVISVLGEYCPLLVYTGTTLKYRHIHIIFKLYFYFELCVLVCRRYVHIRAGACKDQRHWVHWS